MWEKPGGYPRRELVQNPNNGTAQTICQGDKETASLSQAEVQARMQRTVNGGNELDPEGGTI